MLFTTATAMAAGACVGGRGRAASLRFPPFPSPAATFTSQHLPAQPNGAGASSGYETDTLLNPAARPAAGPRPSRGAPNGALPFRSARETY
eukprot:366536-Chlamydomonas_euryale.AAC.10